MADPTVFEFNKFRIDFRDERLWSKDKHLPLTNKSFQVLRYLVKNPGRLVTREELITNIWSRRFVTDAAVAMCIKEIRVAVEDRANAPKFIETVRGRGYRFIAPVIGVSNSLESNLGSSKEIPITSSVFDGICVGRSEQMELMSRALQSALASRRKILLLAGETGIGKTTLIESFIKNLGCEIEYQIGRGQCIDFQGPDEPFHPVVEALSGLIRTQNNEKLWELMENVAPTWANQLQHLVDGKTNSNIAQVTGRRRIRELAEYIEYASIQAPVILIFEDVHWCDVSTLTWLNYLAGRRDPARLLIVASYRPIQASNSANPINDLIQRLKVHDQQSEIFLDNFSESDISEYLLTVGITGSVSEDLAKSIFDRSSGIPLFVRMSVDFLGQQCAITKEDSGWVVQKNWGQTISKVPQSITQFIGNQIDQIDTEAIQFLEIASVAGANFSTSEVSACNTADHDVIEEIFNSLTRQGKFIRSAGIQTWPDGTITARYEFIHGIYRKVLYERLSSTSRSRIHIAIGRFLESAYEDRIEAVVVDLCNHFNQGSDVKKAEKYLALAGKFAFDQGANEEAINLYSLALEKLFARRNSDPDSHAEIKYQTKIASAGVALKGFAWSVSSNAFARIHELCHLPGYEKEFVKSMYSVCLFHLDRAELEQASRISNEAMDIARKSNDPTDLMLANRLVGTCELFAGKLDSAKLKLENALKHYITERHGDLRLDFATDVRISILCWLSRTLCLLGKPNTSRELISETLVEARNLNHAHSLAYALREFCFNCYYQKDIKPLEIQAKLLHSLAYNEGYRFELAESQIYLGWLKSQAGNLEAGIDEISNGLQDYQSTGSEFQLPYLLTIAVDAHKRLGNTNEALILVDGAIRRVEKSGEAWYSSYIYDMQQQLHSMHRQET